MKVKEDKFHSADSRGVFRLDWLDSKHTFSFGHYYNADRMGFGALRVLNDDIVSPQGGFDTHPHRDMEIISIPLSGSLEHKDSMGNGSIIRAGEVQLMSAGTGVLHSEYNPSGVDSVNFLQIWVLPEKKQIEPRYQQKDFTAGQKLDEFQLVVSADGEGGSLEINQQAWFSLASLQAGSEITYTHKGKDTVVYLFLIEGAVSANENEMKKRDGLGLTEAGDIQIKAAEASRLLAIEVIR